MKTTQLLLDLDGTLVDSSLGIYQSFELACQSLDLECPTRIDFCRLIGPPIQQIASMVFPDLDPMSIEQFKCVFRADYDRIGFLQAHWYPGVIETIISLAKDTSLNMSVITNKPTGPAAELIKQAGLSSCITRTVGIDYLIQRESGRPFSSKSEALSFVLSTSSPSVMMSAYVGDTPSDQDACSIVNVPFIAALYGFHRWNEEQLPVLHVRRFKDIKCLLENLKTERPNAENSRSVS